MMASVANQGPQPREYILYRWWDSEGRLLYVGKSISLYKRMAEHRRGSAFFADAATMTIERLRSPEQLAAAEMRAIKTENPMYNIMGGRHVSGAASRRVVLAEIDPTTPGYWESIEYHNIAFGDVIRWNFKHSPLNVIGQGIVDDYDYDDEGHHEWCIFTAQAEEIILDEFIAGLCDLKRWAHAPGDETVEAYKAAAILGLTGEAGEDAR